MSAPEDHYPPEEIGEGRSSVLAHSPLNPSTVDGSNASKPMRRGVLRCDPKIIADILGFPSGLRVIGVRQSYDWDTIDFLLSGEPMPITGNGYIAPDVQMRVREERGTDGVRRVYARFELEDSPEWLVIQRPMVSP